MRDRGPQKPDDEMVWLGAKAPSRIGGAGLRSTPLLSVIVPAFNEEAYLPRTLQCVREAAVRVDGDVQVIVVDNASTDGTAGVARGLGAGVVAESRQGVAFARNAGARVARAPLLVWVDADTALPGELLRRIVDECGDLRVVGGGVETRHRPHRMLVALWLALWRVGARALRMVQGSVQFCRRSAFDELGGYDERLFMGEDVDFAWRLQRLARRTGSRFVLIRDTPVEPSARRWEQWALGKILFWTNPLVIAALRRRRGVWRGWYVDPPR